jgi:hypothetical protein
MKVLASVPGVNLYPGTVRHWWEDISTEEIVGLASLADELGFDYLTIPEHLVVRQGDVHQMGSRWLHSLSTAGFILGATRRIKVVCMVVVPYHNALELAKSISTLDFVSGGRIVVVAMLGYNKWEFDMLGVEFDRRREIMDKNINVIKELLEPVGKMGSSPDQGEDSAVFAPRPLVPIPFWFGGRSRSALRRIARFGDGWLSYAVPRSNFQSFVEFLRAEPAFLERPRDLELSLPIFEGRRDPDSHQVIEQPHISFDRSEIMKQVDIVARLGATMVEVDDLLGTGKYQNDSSRAPRPTTSYSHHRSRMQWFAEELLSEIHAINTVEENGFKGSLQ